MRITSAFPGWATNKTSLSNQTPIDAISSATGVVDYWVGRMVGYALDSSRMSSLYTDQATSSGVPAAAKATPTTTNTTLQRTETALRRLVSMIATTQDFTYR